MSQNNGMTEDDAKAFHGYFIMMMSVFVGASADVELAALVLIATSSIT